ncbi:cytochrome P450 [Cryphonectria parasitica EP155]|uniref:Cytochrome P450 n=1 Tax=Cryphonectria parasitica (strain ATCC 38755 / EP155) TaxID=660469 RepID=A0A9P4XRU7_CRYP1|nr:cytochrome P450 [Cryphonectria parasitica EP155]KAF3759878.1 cytochrome P450 [Cryphonectria parasitica EP155]
MAVSLNLPILSEEVPVSIQFVAAALILSLAYLLYTAVAPERPHKGFPLVSLPEGGLSHRVILKGLAEHNGRPFQVMGATGPRIVLPNSYADEIKNHPSLSLEKALKHDFYHKFPGFEALEAAETTGMKDFDFLVEVVVKLTQSLGVVTPDLVDETTHAVHDILGDDGNWHSMTIKQDMLQLIARMSSRVFLGHELCRNQHWLRIARDHSVEVMTAARILFTVNPLLRPIKQLFLEPCVRLRRARDEAHDLIQPVVEQRRALVRKALAAGSKPPRKTDSISWMYETARDKSEQVDYSGNQLMLMMVSIHTTTEQLSQTLVNLLANPHLIQPLRDEIASVVGAEGWSKTALHNMRLMDAFLRESSRFNPLSHVSMNRRVVRPMTLSTGEKLPVGAIVMISDNYADPTLYADPDKFDPYRYIAAREANPHSNYHVSLTPSHMGFGYGAHACPGRFLASNMMKIAMAFMVMNYDWRVGAELRARSKKEREVEVDFLIGEEGTGSE